MKLAFVVIIVSFILISLFIIVFLIGWCRMNSYFDEYEEMKKEIEDYKTIQKNLRCF